MSSLPCVKTLTPVSRLDELVERDKNHDCEGFGAHHICVKVDAVAELGPGAIVGEKALLEGGTRTATIRAATPCRIAVIPGELIDKRELEDLAATRRA